MRIRWGFALVLALSSICVVANAGDQSEMVEGIAEDLAKYIFVGDLCGFAIVPEARQTMQALEAIDPKAAARGAASGFLIVEGGKRVSRKAQMCAQAKAKRAKFDADIRNAAQGLAKLAEMSRPAVGTPPGEPLTAVSSGANYLAASSSHRSLWVVGVVSRMADKGSPDQRKAVELIVARCLNDMLAPVSGKAGEADRHKRMELAALSAMCALPAMQQVGVPN